MPEDLEVIEAARQRLYQELLSLGDFRQGSISATFSKCGKKKCVCAQEGHSGHGPYYRWTATHHGKTVAQHLRLGPELDMVQKQIENGRRFHDWYQECIAANEQICRLRPVPEVEDEKDLTALKKKLRRRFSLRRRKKSRA